MGIYDIIHVNKIICPQCGEDNDNFEFHIKLLKNYSKMHSFTFPDIIDQEKGSYPIEGVCSYCSALVKGKVLVEDQLLKKITYWVENCPVKIIRADFEKSYIELKILSNSQEKN